jgi:hypothetical protein
MNQDKKNKLEKKILETTNVKQMFDVVGEFYDLENSKPGTIAKKTFIAKLPALAIMLSAKEKN